MRLEYVAISSGQRLDTLEIEGDAVRYRTGRARPVAESVIRRGGVGALSGWTNGYVVLRPAD
jgi:hypothetical protein